MMRYSIEHRDRKFVKGFLSFTKDISENFGKNISKSLSGNYNPGILVSCQKLLDHAKQSATDALKTISKRATEETADTTGDLNGNKIADEIKNFSRSSPLTSSAIVRNEIRNVEHDEEIPKERYVYPEKYQ